MRTTLVVAMMCAGCVAGGERAAVQEVTGVTVTVRDVGQLAVSWTADPSAARYLVYQSVGGALPALVATVLDSSGGAPSTSWIATGLTGGVEYCYSIRSVFADGGVGAPGAGACGTATGSGGSGMRTRVIAPSPDGVHPYVTIDVTQGIGHATSNLDGYFDLGAHLRAMRIHVTDNPLPGPAVGATGPTKMQATLRTFGPSSGSVPVVLGQSPFSDGSGHEQTLGISGIDVVIAPGGGTHSVQVLPSFGNAPTVEWSIEVDYTMQ